MPFQFESDPHVEDSQKGTRQDEHDHLNSNGLIKK